MDRDCRYTMKDVNSYNVQIWVGLRKNFTEKYYKLQDVRKICDQFVNDVGDCVTIIPIEYRYTGGSEPGVVIGWINYPKFPKTKKEIKQRAFRLAKALMKNLEQHRVSVVTPKKTYMITAK